jgi:crotonyl-CoA carboxylase/reductase
VPPAWDAPEWKQWFEGAKAFGKAIWDALGERTNPRIVFEHPGQDTIPTSNFVCDRGGMIVICAGTTGYDTLIDVRYLWYLQKRYQGSHLFNDDQAAAFNQLVIDGTVTTTLGEVYPYQDAGRVHQLMGDGELPEGNVSVLISAPQAGLTGLP